MTLKTKSCIGIGHTTAVIDDLYRCLASVAYENLYVLRSCIDGILYKLLDDRRRALYYFACGYLVSYGIR
jgi:nitrate reductase beta subunit